MLAVVRPGSWNVALFIHVAGAMALVATLILASFAVRRAAAAGDQPSTRFAFRTLLIAVLPSYVVMRVGAQLIASKEKLTNAKLTWLDIGFIASDAGMALLIAALVLTGLAARKAKGGTPVGGSGGLKAANVLTGLLIAVYVVTIFAMTAKPD